MEIRTIQVIPATHGKGVDKNSVGRVGSHRDTFAPLKA